MGKINTDLDISSGDCNQAVNQWCREALTLMSALRQASATSAEGQVSADFDINYGEDKYSPWYKQWVRGVLTLV